MAHTLQHDRAPVSAHLVENGSNLVSEPNTDPSAVDLASAVIVEHLLKATVGPFDALDALAQSAAGIICACSDGVDDALSNLGDFIMTLTSEINSRAGKFKSEPPAR